MYKQDFISCLLGPSANLYIVWGLKKDIAVFLELMLICDFLSVRLVKVLTKGTAFKSGPFLRDWLERHQPLVKYIRNAT